MNRHAADARTIRALDRALSQEILDAAYRIAQLDVPDDDRSARLTIALREHTTEADASNKMKKTVTRVWTNPPEPARTFIRWALDHPEEFPDRRLMHLGALLATVPFVGTVMSTLGRTFALGELITVPDLRRKLTQRWGQSSTVQEAAGKTVTTLRRLGAVTGGGRQAVGIAEALPTTPTTAGWLVHATILNRSVDALEEREVAFAPELFWASPLAPDQSYPHLTNHNEGINRRVWVVR